uniref:SCP domain-containing protein n=1 Tax=Globisporangium ultimum (strain ATCC 200006 / CBS 805.95 / DAOM BR144) TaxID=431595 RepID=K3WDG4_GLOUD
MRSFSFGVAAILALAVCSSADALISNGNVAISSHQEHRALQIINFRKELVTAVNAKRSEKGLSALCINNKLMAAAQVMSNDMAETNSVSATGSDGSSPTSRAEAQKFNSSSGVAELVGAGYETVPDIMNAWIKSADTSSTLYGNYTHIGPGYTFNKNQIYWNYWVLDFAASNEACNDT